MFPHCIQGALQKQVITWYKKEPLVLEGCYAVIWKPSVYSYIFLGGFCPVAVNSSIYPNHVGIFFSR